MNQAALVLVSLATATTLLGLFPCVGWMNWVAVPLSVASTVIGIIGVTTDRDPATGRTRHAQLYTAAIVVGIVAAAIGGLRCMLGGGVV